MAFHDHLALDPKSEEEFWTIIEETFIHVEATLTTYPAETREQALRGTLRNGNFKDASLSFIRDRGVRDDLDSRDYFLELGRKVLPGVERQIKARQLTPKFAKDWGVVMMCHGFIASHILDDSDGLDRVRAGQSGNRNTQRKWFAHLVLHWIDKGIRRKAAEGEVEKHIKSVTQNGGFPPRFPKNWFESMLIEDVLAQTYNQKHLPIWKLRELAALATDDIPPIKFPP
jgi:hypothetical protein